ncbi:hypothetical protein [Pseudomonas lopnurensis]|jgi:hypothetical protein|uniref:hypothetical protein n=1 Tax=Pseudomonas lopnurensis TaxID=1477517 RepID=UPI0028AB1C1B|nr:hypothetical protein [Pseudomonas lopnurensis]
MAVRLEFLTQNPEEMELAIRYWATDKEGAFLERVADLVPFREIIQSGQIAKKVREYCIAFDENQSCYLCERPIRINGRADVKKIPQSSSIPCESCADEQNRKRAELEAQDQAEVNRRLAALIERNASSTLNYSGLPDDVVLILLAINAVVAPRLADGTFGIGDCEGLAPWDPGEFTKQLYRDGFLLEDPRAAKTGTYYLKSGDLWHKTYQLELFLPPDTTRGRGNGALNLLEEHCFSDPESLIKLWLDYSVGDVLRYLFDQCSVYNHDLDEEAIDTIKSTVRHGLQTYSVSQLWSVMWKVVRDAASLANREYYNRTKAAATIPKKIRKLLELADQQGGISRCWDRPEYHLAGSLGMIFSNLFGVDEYSPGAKVIEMFNRIGRPAQPQGDDNLRSLAGGFMRSALDGPNPWLVMSRFADKIRDGLTTEDAMVEVFNQHSEMFA